MDSEFYWVGMLCSVAPFGMKRGDVARHETWPDTRAGARKFSAILKTSIANISRSYGLLNHINMTATVLLAGAFLLALFFSYIYQQKRQEYMLVWAAGWMLISLHFLVPALGTWLAPVSWVVTVDDWLLAAAVLSFYCAARMYARLKVSWGGVAGLGVAAAICALGYSRGWVNVPLVLGVG